ncbi:MAG TPA: class I SAM-dependent methyltransferase [Ktedonobacteraceae bacterium]|nr:class I SAM-dependent methyltransferase [Ktedonobacteraceae bacterium]
MGQIQVGEVGQKYVGLDTRTEFPRSARYDPLWVLENLMGPHPLWLAESLSQIMELEPDTRVMDLGCGKAITSIFLAQEFHLQVWATDLWVSASDNWQRIRAAKREQQVFPISAEAHSLPFAHEFFDAIVSFDAYHYFRTDDLYLGYIARFVRPGGSIAIVVPGVVQEVTGGLPAHLAAQWQWDWCSFHSPPWWKQHWEKTGLVEVQTADMVPNGWQHWLRWLEVCQEEGFPAPAEEIDLLRADAGRTLGFTRLVARRK